MIQVISMAHIKCEVWVFEWLMIFFGNLKYKIAQSLVEECGHTYVNDDN